MLATWFIFGNLTGALPSGNWKSPGEIRGDTQCQHLRSPSCAPRFMPPLPHPPNRISRYTAVSITFTFLPLLGLKFPTPCFSNVFYVVQLYFSWPHRVACGILVPWPGIKPRPPAVEAQSPNHGIAREVLCRSTLKDQYGDFPGGAVVKNPPANAGDTRSSPGLGRSHMPRSN